MTRDPCLIYPDTIVYPWTVVYPGGLCPPSQRIYGSIIPAYSYPSPTTTWDGWITGAPMVKFMIADPGSPGGPGVSVDANYQAAILHAQRNQVRILGYVSTSYGAVSIAAMKADVDAWKTLYGIKDIFLDQVSSGAGDIAHYQQICDYAHLAKGSVVMLNPGTNPDEGYFRGMADIVCPFEGSQSDFDAYIPPDWIGGYPPSMVAHLIYDVPTLDQASADITRSTTNCNAGYVYITDDTLAGFPWDSLPSYWSGEMQAMRTINNPNGLTGGGGEWITRTAFRANNSGAFRRPSRS